MVEQNFEAVRVTGSSPVGGTDTRERSPTEEARDLSPRQ